jgi:hypothetical protein
MEKLVGALQPWRLAWPWPSPAEHPVTPQILSTKSSAAEGSERAVESAAAASASEGRPNPRRGSGARPASKCSAFCRSGSAGSFLNIAAHVLEGNGGGSGDAGDLTGKDCGNGGSVLSAARPPSK